jgi:hypothetical protein
MRAYSLVSFFRFVTVGCSTGCKPPNVSALGADRQCREGNNVVCRRASKGADSNTTMWMNLGSRGALSHRMMSVYLVNLSARWRSDGRERLESRDHLVAVE